MPELSHSIELHELELSDTEINALAQEVVDLAFELQMDINFPVAQTCVEHLLYVNQVNEYMNLTRIKDLHEALVLHIVDSLVLARELPFEPEHFLDIGTGGGFPGIPLALLTDASAILLDSVGKKITAVNAFIEQLGLDNVHGVHDRCESYAKHHPSEFDLVVARAVGQMNLIIEYAAPFLENDGILLLAKANPTHEERRLADKTADICGLELIGVDEFELPRNLGHRTVLLYQKVDEPKVKLPRAVGLAKSKPLAR